MYMVSRWFAPDVEARVAQVHEAHQRHIGRFSNTVGSSLMIDEASGRTLGVIAFNDFETRAEIDHYVHDDPYTLAGAYSRIEIQKVQVYVWDGYYARTSPWFLEKHPEHADRFTPKQPYTRRNGGG
ncbi:MAG: hypothetical protein U1F18_07115 [Steroidobacteraceae bacterium]